MSFFKYIGRLINLVGEKIEYFYISPVERQRTLGCQSEIDPVIVAQINAIQWSGLECLIKGACGEIPKLLRDIHCPNNEISEYSAYKLYCLLADINKPICTAAIKAYDIIRNRAFKSEGALQTILFIILENLITITFTANNVGSIQAVLNQEMKEIFYCDKLNYQHFLNHSNDTVKHSCTQISDLLYMMD